MVNLSTILENTDVFSSKMIEEWCEGHETNRTMLINALVNGNILSLDHESGLNPKCIRRGRRTKAYYRCLLANEELEITSKEFKSWLNKIEGYPLPVRNKWCSQPLEALDRAYRALYQETQPKYDENKSPNENRGIETGRIVDWLGKNSDLSLTARKNIAAILNPLPSSRSQKK